ncbi:MAG: hypothetical protein VKM97_07210 [Cyanobacteriota bacterium]|nr:hypothetical protein [Cyanobacteriota bacterium]
MKTKVTTPDGLKFTINVPEGYEIQQENDGFKVVKKQGVEWKDFGDVTGAYIETDCRIFDYSSSRASSTNRNIFPTESEAKACLALSQLLQWRDKYNGEPIADWCDWTDEAQRRWAVFFHKEEITISVMYNSRTALAFKTKEIAELFAKDFEQLIIEAKPLL